MRSDQERARRAYEDMVRRLAELDRLDGIDLTPRHPRSRPSRRRRMTRLAGRRPGTAGTLTIVVLLLAGFLYGTGSWRDLLDTSPARSSAATESSQWPPMPDDARPHRLLAPVASGVVGVHAFQELRPNGRPVTYDPCRPLHYVINPARSPAGGLGMVREAIQEISAATGLAFVEDGVTDEKPVSDRSPLQVDRYGNRWAPVLIAWSTEGELDMLGGDIAGFGGSHMLAPGGPGTERFVSGQIVLDADVYAELAVRPDGLAQGRAIIMHELGHVLGLLHVPDSAELMHESNVGQLELGPGDRQGLAVVGDGDCFSDT